MNASTHQRLRAAALGIASGAAASVATAGAPFDVIQVIYTKIPTHPSSIVPGALDLDGNPVETRFRAMEQLIPAHDNMSWMLRGRTQLGSDLETILILGANTAGSMFLQEGRPMPAGEPGELVDFFGSATGTFDENGRFAFSLRARGGVAANAQKVLLWDSPNFTELTQQGDPYTGLVDNPPAASGDEVVGNSIGSIHLLNNGTFGAHDSTIVNIHSSRRPALFYDNDMFHQINITSVVNLDDETLTMWIALDGNKFYTTPDGAHWYAQGRTSAPTDSDAVLVYDGRVRIREGNPIPDSSIVVNAINNTELLSNGDWFTRGTTIGGGAWATHNGAVVAATGDSIGVGPEALGATFLGFSGDRNGNWILVGSTDNPDTATDQAIILNGDRVVVREGDPVDLDGNGLFDDNVFIGRGNDTLGAFSVDSAFLTDDGWLYFLANLRDGEGNDLNSDPAFSTPVSFLRMRVDTGGAITGPDFNGDGVVDGADLAILLGQWGPCPPPCPYDLDGDGTVGGSDLAILLGAWGPK